MTPVRLALLCCLLLSPLGAEHLVASELPALRMPLEDWTGARARVARDKRWKRWLDGREAVLLSWRQNADRVNWVAGSQQDWFNVGSGEHLAWRPDTQIPPADTNATTTRTRRGAWISFQRAHNIERVHEAALFFRLTGKRDMLDWAANQLDFYAENYARWPLQTWNGHARMMGQALDEATACVALIDTVRLLRQVVAQDRVEAWHRRLFAPMAENLSSAYQGNNNISLWTRVAMALIALEFEDEALLSRAIESEHGVRKLLEANVSTDGFWKEGSLSYQAYVVTALTPLLEAASLKSRSALVHQAADDTGRMLLSPLILRFPDGTLPAIGDARSGTPAIDRGLFEHTRRVLPTAVGLIEASLHLSWEALLDPPDIPVGPAAIPSVTNTHFPSLRAALLKDGDWQVFLHYGQATGFHAQAEALNAEIVHAGEYLLRDPGTVAYGSDLHQNFYRTAAAHSVPLIDGIGQEGWAPGELEQMTATSVAAVQPNYNRLAVARRRISLANGYLIDEQSLHAKDRQTHRLGFIVSTPCTVELTEANPLLRPASTQLPASPGFAYWQPSTAWRNEKVLKTSFKCDEQSYAVAFSLPGAYRVVQAQVPDTRPSGRRTALYFETEGRDTVLSSRFVPTAAENAKK